MTIAGTPHIFVGAPFILRKGQEILKLRRHLVGLLLNRNINPGRVFDLTLPLEHRRLPRDGRTPRDQGASAAMSKCQKNARLLK